jgi:hypothetical protein
VDSDGAGRQNHSLRSSILAPIPTTAHTRTLPAMPLDVVDLRTITMKYFVFALTLIGHFIAILTLKLLDNFFPVIFILLGSVVFGLITLTTNDKKSKRRKIGWGLFYGSITSLTLTIAFMIYLNYALSR